MYEKCYINKVALPSFAKLLSFYLILMLTTNQSINDVAALVFIINIAHWKQLWVEEVVSSTAPFKCSQAIAVQNFTVGFVHICV